MLREEGVSVLRGSGPDPPETSALASPRSVDVPDLHKAYESRRLCCAAHVASHAAAALPFIRFLPFLLASYTVRSRACGLNAARVTGGVLGVQSGC